MTGVFLIARRVLFSPSFFVGYKDVITEWLPNFCFLGKSLATGHIPAWNPHVFGGMPFAADPLHGWMNLPAMLLFSILPCSAALRLYMVLQPVIAGIALYWFLRTEGFSRSAATIGGLAISLPVAGSQLIGALWFTPALAWTAVLLAAIARYVRAERTSARFLLVIFAAVAWGQVAAAHVTNGLVLGTAALSLYLIAFFLPRLRNGTARVAAALRSVGLLAIGFLGVNLAYLLPRLGFLGQSTLSHGYLELHRLSLRLSHGAGGALAAEPFGTNIRIDWPLRLALSPGLHVGAIVLAFPILAGWTRRHRSLAISFALFGLICYLLTLPAATRAPRSLGTSPVTSFYLHSPFRFGLGLLIALPILAAIGADAWRERWSFLGPGLTIGFGLGFWGVLAYIHGGSPSALLLFILASLASIGAIAGSRIRPGVALLLPAILFAELLANGLVTGSSPHVLFPPNSNRTDLDRFLREGPIARAIAETQQDGRYISITDRWTRRGPQTQTSQAYEPLLARQQSMLFGLQEAQGYNSIQVFRYWQFVRAVDPKAMRYAVTYFLHPRPVALNLLQIRWLIAPRGRPPVPQAIAVTDEGRWTLYQLPDAPPRASLVTEWTVVRSPDAALQAVAAPTFDPSSQVVLERDPGIGPPSGDTRSGGVSVRKLGPQGLELVVETPQPAILLVRDTYDPGWHATLDGRDIPVLPADYVVQGIPVPAGRHRIRLSYDEPTIGFGLLGSAISVALLMCAWALARRRERRFEAERRPGSVPPHDGADRLDRVAH